MFARASTCKCFVTACRVTYPPCVNWAMDSGPSVLSRAMRRSRVSSPSAAKTGAASGGRCGFTAGSGRLCEIALDGHHLLGPAAVVAPVGGVAILGRHAVESRLCHGEQRPSIGVLEVEFDQGCGL